MIWSGAKFVSLALTVLLSTSLIEAAPKGTGISLRHDINSTEALSVLPAADGWAPPAPPAVIELSKRAGKASHKKTGLAKKPKTKKPKKAKKPKTTKPKKAKKPKTTKPKKAKQPKTKKPKKAKKPKAPKKPVPPKACTLHHKTKGSKGRHHKRTQDAETGCEQPTLPKAWDFANVKAMEDNTGTPKMAEHNQEKYYFVSDKWSYTPKVEGNQKPELKDEMIREMGAALADAQQKYFASKNVAGVRPWKDRVPPPPVIALSAEESEQFEGSWIIRAASNFALKPDQGREKGVEPVVPEALKKLQESKKGQRAWGNENGLHGEEIIGGERGYEGKPLFKGLKFAAYEIRLGKYLGAGPQPIQACSKNCAKLLEAEEAQDLNSGKTTKYQEDTSRSNQQGGGDGSGDEYRPRRGD